MMKVVGIIGLCLAFLGAPLAAAGKSEKLLKLEREMIDAEQRVKTGKMWTLGGGGVFILSYFMFSNATNAYTSGDYATLSELNSATDNYQGQTQMWSGVMLLSAIAMSYGSWTWYSASNHLSLIKMKEYDLTLGPVGRDDLAMDLGLKVTF